MRSHIMLKNSLLARSCTCKVDGKSTITRPQVNQLTLRLPKAGEPNDPADFKEKPPVDQKEIRDYLSQMIFKIENSVWQRVVRSLYNKYDKEFYSYPAAKTNHPCF